ncbi:site-2 protease family protein [Aeoliella mucimassa]|uniref:Peptidase family M50 n=1 Tax=Aeoliella mucimassa TaxID=2527972 RepID=A0A518AHF3_9BACT|nr:site-2 protease family protein [Aeoliella mucimassa]QDU54150.1 Peptidase family M50 [Aeoliella mucimassa]
MPDDAQPHETPTTPPAAAASAAPEGAASPARGVEVELTAPDHRPVQVEVQAEYRELRSSDLNSADDEDKPIRRNIRLPILLFIATCMSTFWVGATHYKPTDRMGSTTEMWQVIQHNWQDGLIYMGAVLAILLTHEMGHFLQTLRHRIPASYPLCIPVPFNPIGTMGAVISMDGMKADRKQIFDIGLAGPLAGLAVAIPILCIGVGQLDLSTSPGAPREIQLNSPLIVTLMIDTIHPEWSDRADWISISQVNPWFMAGWVGMLITGLNMMPISQLDGGHTLYGLFGPQARTYAQGFVIAAIVYVVLFLEQAALWTPMLILVILMGVHHPPTADDDVELDDVRWIVGVASLSIPVLCFPLLGLKQ